MLKKYKALALSCIMLLSLCACSTQGDTAMTGITAIHTRPAKPSPSQPPEPSPTPQQTDDEATFFDTLPQQFMFLSGAGAWSTELYMTGDEDRDGSFTGEYHDTDVDVVYYCDFTGKFGQPEKLDEFSYSITLEALEYDPPGAERVEDGIRFVSSTPYGLENAGELRVYLPGYPIRNIPEDDRFWLAGIPAFWSLSFEELAEKELPPGTYAIHNVNEGELFFGLLPEAEADAG